MNSTLVRSLWVTFLVGVFLGCSTAERERSKATILPDSDWMIKEDYNYPEGYTADFLIGNNLSIKITPWNDQYNIERSIFVIQLIFNPERDGEFRFDPSLVVVRSANHDPKNPKGLPCSGTILDRHYLRSAPALNGRLSINKHSCFLLFVDSPPPTVKDEFTMKLGGLTKDGESLNIPEILFREGFSR
jgi:hypothetical protein